MPDASAVPNTELFGSFVLGNDEFALPASCFREVVNYPDKVSALPLSPKFLEGVFTLRGSVIPVVNLGRVFNPEARAARPTDKIAILDYQGVLVGILFDATGEILRVRPEQRSTLTYPDGEKRGVVAGTILLDHGARLVQVLDPDALVHIENVPQVLALQSADRQARRHHGERRQCVSFRVGASSFAFEMAAIQEIIRVPELQASVLNSALCLGRINFRGNPVAVVDFATLLNAAPGERVDHPEQRIIVARIDDATIGFLVDSVDNIVHFYSEDIMPIPMLSKARAGMFGGCLSKPGLGDIFFLDHQQIFSSTEIKEMRNGHANLYPKDEAQAAQNQQRDVRRGQRKVYITFALENSYAVEIKQVREIIDLSVGEITRPPGLPAFMRGMLNLRKQMVTVIDLRGLYQMPPLADTSQSKILVVERGDECYGLLVDAVENIMTINDNRRFAAPKMMRNPDAHGDPRAEMDEVIDIEGEGDAHRTLSVFQCERLLERLGKEIPALAA
ncbi:purine-binding chemotaxis protein CheW [Duganella sp. SG902]|uniref:chemotaxis protein CheW n=1 Tax=Duganella sp. SG902 TaxID=2587016 RepID=UPI00159DDB49|nr:chemotaxis protein CheW [Duganella sp. SG902]NVM79436.1 purine-binding chemotaxis protein CheW [Duganella sp. SG902]